MTQNRAPRNLPLPTPRRRYALLLLRLCVVGMAVTLAVIAIVRIV